MGPLWKTLPKFLRTPKAAADTHPTQTSTSSFVNSSTWKLISLRSKPSRELSQIHEIQTIHQSLLTWLKLVGFEKLRVVFRQPLTLTRIPTFPVLSPASIIDDIGERRRAVKSRFPSAYEGSAKEKGSEPVKWVVYMTLLSRRPRKRYVHLESLPCGYNGRAIITLFGGTSLHCKRHQCLRLWSVSMFTCSHSRSSHVLA